MPDTAASVAYAEVLLRLRYVRCAAPRLVTRDTMRRLPLIGRCHRYAYAMMFRRRAAADAHTPHHAHMPLSRDADAALMLPHTPPCAAFAICCGAPRDVMMLYDAAAIDMPPP